jgi:hypothetical protein
MGKVRKAVETIALLKKSEIRIREYILRLVY